MKNWDHVLSGKYIWLSDIFSPQSDPEILDFVNDLLRISFRGTLVFHDVFAYRVLLAEMPPYKLISDTTPYVPYLYEIDHRSYDVAKLLKRGDSWYPKIAKAYDPNRWFQMLDSWIPDKSDKPDLPDGLHHYITHGHDESIEVLAKSATFEPSQPKS